MRFRAKDSAIREKIATLRANHIARTTSDFKMDLIKADKPRGMLVEEFVNYEPQANDLRILRVFFQHPKTRNFSMSLPAQ